MNNQALEMVTIRQAMVRTGLSYGCLRAMIDEEVVEYWMTGNRYYINLASIGKALKGGKTVKAATSITLEKPKSSNQ